VQRAPELLQYDDEAPPPSGVRARVVPPPPAEPSDALVLAEVAGEVCADVFDCVRTLAPLQGVWFGLGWNQLGGVALSAARLWQEGGRSPAVLRRRWPELVPGAAALDRLVWLMTDLIC
jgi:hypothetical protein